MSEEAEPKAKRRRKHAAKRLTIKKVNKILGLHLNGATQAEIVAATQSSPNSVVSVLKSFEQVFSNINELAAYRSVRADLLDATELMALKSLNDSERLAGASWRDIAQGFEKIAKINRLYQGQSTSNTQAVVQFFDRSDPDL